jgi:hypothetical protein
MTLPSRGISDIQEKARGNKMTKLKAGMAPLKKKDTLKAKVTKRAPTPDMAQIGAMRSAGLKAVPGSPTSAMKKGGSCRGMYKGGSVDGIVKKGRTHGKII